MCFGSYLLFFRVLNFWLLFFGPDVDSAVQTLIPNQISTLPPTPLWKRPYRLIQATPRSRPMLLAPAARTPPSALEATFACSPARKP